MTLEWAAMHATAQYDSAEARVQTISETEKNMTVSVPKFSAPTIWAILVKIVGTFQESSPAWMLLALHWKSSVDMTVTSKQRE